MEHLLPAWPKVTDRIRYASHIWLFVDYDGTLVSIVERPELANLSEDVRKLLQSLALQPKITLGIISGRSLDDLKNKVGINDIVYAGNHGLEIEGLGISFVNPVADELRPIFRIMQQVLIRGLNAVRGVFVENKGLSLSIHYRQVERHNTGVVEGIVKRIVGGAEANGQVKITPGKEVYEVRPVVSWDKGKAIKFILKRYAKGGRKSGILPMYIGDDLTDEDGFRFIDNYGTGISVFVGEPARESTASYFLRSPAEVIAFLRLLLEQSGKVSDTQPG